MAAGSEKKDQLVQTGYLDDAFVQSFAALRVEEGTGKLVFSPQNLYELIQARPEDAAKLLEQNELTAEKLIEILRVDLGLTEDLPELETLVKKPDELSAESSSALMQRAEEFIKKYFRHPDVDRIKGLIAIINDRHTQEMVRNNCIKSLERFVRDIELGEKEDLRSFSGTGLMDDYRT